MTGAEPQESDGDSVATVRRSRLIAAAVLAAIVVIAVVAVIAFNGSNDDTAAEGPGTDTSTADGEGIAADEDADPGDDPAPSPSESQEVPGADASTGGDTQANGGADVEAGPVPVGEPLPSGLAVFVEPIAGGSELEVCNAVVARLREFRRVAQEQAMPEPVVLEAMTELESNIMTLADNQDWGDRIAEQLTGVVREWANVRSAEATGDEDRASESSREAVGFIDRAIKFSDCPTI